MTDLNSFITWGMFAEFTTFVAIIVMIVQFIKELPLIKKVPTKYLSAIMAFGIMTIVAMHDGTFALWNLFIYGVTSISVSAISKGLIEYNSDKKTKQPKDDEDIYVEMNKDL